jgi:hypothetical protein
MDLRNRLILASHRTNLNSAMVKRTRTVTYGGPTYTKGIVEINELPRREYYCISHIFVPVAWGRKPNCLRSAGCFNSSFNFLRHVTGKLAYPHWDLASDLSSSTELSNAAFNRRNRRRSIKYTIRLCTFRNREVTADGCE